MRHRNSDQPLGWHKCSLAYVSNGQRRYNQPFHGTPYGPEFVQGDVIGVGYRPRTGSVFFTRNGKKLDDVTHGLKTQNFFPTVGANGPCTVHVNFGQSGFVFIEANVKKWGLAPMTGSLAPPPPYGSEQGSILLEAGRDGSRQPVSTAHIRAGSRNLRVTTPTSPGPQRSPTEISLAQLMHIPSQEDVGEGTSRSARSDYHDSPISPPHPAPRESQSFEHQQQQSPLTQDLQYFSAPPPEYTSPEGSIEDGRRNGETYRHLEDASRNEERTPLTGEQVDDGDDERQDHEYREGPSPPIPSYDAAVGNKPADDRMGNNMRM